MALGHKVASATGGMCLRQVARPVEVMLAEQATGPGTDDDIVRMLTAFNLGVAKVSRLVRRLLPPFGGYECKEPEPGKFTLAFRWVRLPRLLKRRVDHTRAQGVTPLHLCLAMLSWPCPKSYIHVC